MISISSILKKLAGFLIQSGFEQVVNQTWLASKRNPVKFIEVITPQLERLKGKMDPQEEKEKTEQLFKGTDRKMKLIKDLRGTYSVEAV